MGTTIEHVLWGVSSSVADDLEVELRARFERWERIFSRFAPESELSLLNHRSGQWVPVSETMFTVLMAAYDGFIISNGRFDATILESLEQAGYDRSFEMIRTTTIDWFETRTLVDIRTPGMQELEFDRQAHAVRIPAGVRIDLGGIAKGAFVDSLDELLRELPGSIVDAGGDLRLWGYPGNEDSWRIGIQHPGMLGVDIAELQFLPGESVAVATSSTRTRTWLAGTTRQTHLIDPRVGRAVPWTTPSITVVANSVTRAEIEAKSILIALARGERIPYTCADLVVVAHEDGEYESFTPHTAVA